MDAAAWNAARCAACHAEKPSFEGIASAPKGVLLESESHIRAQAGKIREQAVVTRVMPPGNLTGITEDERALLGRWAQGLHGDTLEVVDNAQTSDETALFHLWNLTKETGRWLVQLRPLLLLLAVVAGGRCW